MEEKVGKLPVRYMRVQADDEEELQLFIRGMQEFSGINFYLDDSKEKKRLLETEEEEDDEQGGLEKNKKKN